jgi:hypothetical protein
MSYNRQYAPWLDDPDPPAKPMSEEERQELRRKLAAWKPPQQEKAQPARPAQAHPHQHLWQTDEELVRQLMTNNRALTEEEARNFLNDFGGH